MKRFRGLSVILISAVFMLLTGVSLYAQITVGADIGRAYTPDESPLSDTGIIQPYFNFRYEQISLEAWASYNTGDSLDEYQELTLEIAMVEETDYYFLKAGLIHYRYSDEEFPSTSEVFADLALGPAQGPYLKAACYFDIDEFVDYYALIGPGYYLPIGYSSALRGEVTMGIAGSSYSETGRGGLYDLVTKITYEYFFTDSLTLLFTVKYIDTLDEDIFPFPEINLYLLAGLSYTF